jgi:hypothetical protein
VTWRKISDGSSVGEAEGVSWRYINDALTSWQSWLSLGYYMSIVTPLYGVWHTLFQGRFCPLTLSLFFAIQVGLCTPDSSSTWTDSA